MKNGKTTEGVLLDIKNTTLELNKQNKTLVSVKEVQEGVAKLSNTFRLRTKGGVEELVKAVFEAKKLGVNMEQAAAMSSSLLDFESSIQNELEAELLLGQDINLESARALALQGDQIGAAKEVLKNESILKAFKEGNVIQQEAAARAAGLTVDELANVVTEQENIKILQDGFGDGIESMSDAQKKYNDLRAGGMSAEEAGSKIKDKDLAAQLESISAAEKMENITARIQQLFMSLAEPIMAIVTPIIGLLVPAFQAINFLLTPIFDMFAGIAGILTGSTESLSTMETIMGGIGLAALTYLGIIKSIALYKAIIAARDGASALTSATVVALEKSKKKGILSTIGALTIELGIKMGILSASLATNAAMTFGIGVAIAVAAAAAGYAAIKALTKVGDISSAADGKTQVSTKEGGLFELSSNDDLVAAPGAVDKMNQKGGGGGGTQNNAALVARIDQLIATTQQVVNINQQILAKSPVIEMGGNEVSQGINKAEREIQ